ncbi:MAG: pentapeptide repeat-containing protein [Methylococcaceae bacterium]
MSENKIEDCDFSNKNFQGAIFSNKIFKRVNFDNSNLFGTIFNKTHLEDVSFKNANLFGAFFVEADLTNVDFTDADISSSDFTGTTRMNVVFLRAVQDDTVFGEMAIEQPEIIKLEKCQLTIKNEDKLTWHSTMLGFTIKGKKDPDLFVLEALCKWHHFRDLALEKINSNNEKAKITFSHNACSFPVYLWTKNETINIESFYSSSCLKKQKSDMSGLAGISPSDMKNWCLGITQYKTNCYNINNNDITNACLGMTKYQSNCYDIANTDLKNLCLGTTENSTNCYSINNSDLKNTCLGMTEYKTNCYSIQNNNIKNLCLGVTESNTNCYDIH